MKLGVSKPFPHESPEDWAQKHKEQGLSSVVFPCKATEPLARIDAYRDAAASYGLEIAEVGAWSNPMSPDRAKREDALSKCIRELELAEYLGAKCCVNISGALGEKWDGSYPGNYAEGTYEKIILTTQKIIDAVKPKKTAYSLEPMPHMLPDSPEVYLQMLKDIDRKGFGVHLDVVNMLTSARVFFGFRDLVDRCFDLLGGHILSCHLKDAALDHTLTVSIREVPIGEGDLDLGYYMQKADACNPDLPMIIEHQTSVENYYTAVPYILNLYKNVK